MNFTLNRVQFASPSPYNGYTKCDFVRETIGVKTDMRFEALIIMFMLDTKYTLGDRFITNFKKGLMDAFTAQKFLRWASSRADESRHEKACRECEEWYMDQLIKTVNREGNNSSRNRCQLNAIGIFA